MALSPNPNDYLQPGRFIDSNHPAIVELAGSVTDATADDIDNAVALYYRVRDGLRYDPYQIGMTADDYLASAALASGRGWCVPKALVLAALCRAAGIPARVGYADVRNHLSTERLRQAMGTDVFYFHGYTSLYLQGRWVKATPAFNIELCEKFGLRPLEFNGREDSLYHEFDLAGHRHMEYLNDRGEYPDLPFEEMMAVMREHYPGILGGRATAGDTILEATLDNADWEADVAREVSR
ncbi:MAG: transglutaminase family protein [Pseudomonadales bacterium]|nr:transglutaminase family protein [Pseudomonadales bacterium]